MGLDIYVYKIVSNPSEDCFSLIDDNGYYDNRGFPKWIRKYEKTITEKWFDWNVYKELTGIDINNCDILYMSNGYLMVRTEEDISLYKRHKSYQIVDYFGKKCLKLFIKKIPTKRIKTKVLYRKEIGYQRGSFNKCFYEDSSNGKISDYVFDKETLLSYKEKYCKEDYKEYFQKYIIDKFIEDKCIVTFNW